MNRHVGASFTLSVLAVVFFAVILYEPEHARSPRPSASAEPSRPDTAGPASAVARAPAPTPGVHLTEGLSGPVAASSAPTDRTVDVAAPRRPAPSPRVAAASSRPQGTNGETGPMVRVASNRQARPPARRSAFTEVAAGESLADVAVRVYGTPDATNSLWRANRDVIDGRDASLQAGTLLRTP
jgi:hypothetical protein